MDWKWPVFAAAIAYAALFPPSLLAQQAGNTQQNQPAQPAQEAPAAPESQPSQQGGKAEKKPAADERAIDQLVVIGTGFGGHAFATEHEAGIGETALIVKSSFMQQVYGEWYLLDRFGIGLRYINFGETVTSSTSVTAFGQTQTQTSEVDLNVDNWLVTVNWVPLGGRRYARLGVLGGLGVSNYELTETNNPGSSVTASTSGPAALAGFYVDWGADGLGARFGAQYLVTDLDPIEGSSVDVAGRDIYFDVRWAF